MKVPQYGTKKTWGGKSAYEAKLLKESMFKKNVHKCDRLDKTLVYFGRGGASYEEAVLNSSVSKKVSPRNDWATSSI